MSTAQQKDQQFLFKRVKVIAGTLLGPICNTINLGLYALGILKVFSALLF